MKKLVTCSCVVQGQHVMVTGYSVHILHVNSLVAPTVNSHFREQAGELGSVL